MPAKFSRHFAAFPYFTPAMAFNTANTFNAFGSTFYDISV